MSRIWYWSDLHLGHDFVAKLRGFDKTTYGTPSRWHDLHIKEVWTEHVQPKDHIWLLGDISGGRNEDYALDFIGNMPGTKHLIAGNHDSVASIHRGAWKQQEKFLKVFASVQDFARHRVQGQEFLLSHYPYAGDHADREDRYTQYRLRDKGVPLVHGHVHSAWDYEQNGPLGAPMMNVGVDHWFDRPANTEDVIGWLKAEKVIK